MPKRTDGTDKRAKVGIRRALVAFLAEHGASEAEQRRWRRTYAAVLRGLPSRSASVADLVASRVRNTYLAERYSLDARAADPSSPAGAKLAALAHSADMHASRFSLTARDLSYREAGYSEAGADRGAPGVSLDRAAVDANTADPRAELLARLERIARAGVWAPADEAPPPVPVVDGPSRVRVDALPTVAAIVTPPARRLPPAPVEMTREDRIARQQRSGPAAWAAELDEAINEGNRET